MMIVFLSVLKKTVRFSKKAGASMEPKKAAKWGI
jgi:hypothetical protein